MEYSYVDMGVRYVLHVRTYIHIRTSYIRMYVGYGVYTVARYGSEVQAMEYSYVDMGVRYVLYVRTHTYIHIRMYTYVRM